MAQDEPRKQRGGLEQQLRDRGVRLTEQRRELLAIIEDAGEHVRAETLLDLGRERIADLHRATVYRTIALLKRHGLVDELDLLHHEARGHYYEPVPKELELHIVCLECGQVTETTSRHWTDLVKEVNERLDFEVTLARVEIGGVCQACRSGRTS